MRIFLLPISTRRSLIYCERIPQELLGEQSSFARTTNRITTKASQTWADWEKAESGWKKGLTSYGNKVLTRIPFEEWGLKTLPPLTEKRKRMLLDGNEKVDVLFPGLYLKEHKVPEILHKLATERQGLHRRRLMWSIIGMPISAPFALVPVVPNIPFFYLAYRAWSHWKALSGSRHLEFLLSNKLTNSVPSAQLDEMYTAGLIHPSRDASRIGPVPSRDQAEEVARLVEKQTNEGTEDVMLLKRWNGKLLAEGFKLPEMEVEIERAVEQVERSIKAEEQLLEEKRELERATSRPGEEKKE